MMATVPRILSRIYAKVFEGVKTKGGVTEWLFNKAVNDKIENYESSGLLTHKLYDKIIFHKVRILFGGNIKKMVSGSAALDPKILKFFRIALSIPVFEGYGQTETCIVGTFTRATDNTVGHIGSLLPSAVFRLKDVPEMNYYHTDYPPRGELQIKSKACIRTYFKNEERTKELYTDDGFINTGDVVSVLENGNI